MSFSRLNIFNPVHKAQRAMLYQAAWRLQQTDYTCEKQVVPLLSQLEQLTCFFSGHARHEEGIVLPLLAPHVPGLVASFEAQHAEGLRLSDQLTGSIGAWRCAAGGTERSAAGSALFYQFNEYVAFHLHHMSREEEQLNQVLWQYYSDEELLAIEAQILSAVPEGGLLTQCRWMLKGMNNREIIAWLDGVRQSAPEEQFRSFISLAEQTLAPSRWKKIKAALVEGVRVA